MNRRGLNERGHNSTGTGLQQNVAGLLCYVLGWITGIIFLVIEKDNKFIRFHAVQSIVVFWGGYGYRRNIWPGAVHWLGHCLDSRRNRLYFVDNIDGQGIPGTNV